MVGSLHEESYAVLSSLRRLRVWLWRLMLTVAVAVGVLAGLLLF